MALQNGSKSIQSGRAPLRVSVPSDGRARVEWVDHARGLAIILVVYGHSFRGVKAAGYIPPGSVLWAADYVIYSFHMPLFFFLSGLFASRAATGLKSLWLARLAALVRPYLVWMTIEAGLLAAFSGVTNQGTVPFGPSLYLYQPISPFWFLYALSIANVFAYGVRTLPIQWRLALALALFAAGQFATLEIVTLTTWGVLYFTVGVSCAEWVRRPAFARAVGLRRTIAVSGVAGLAFSLLGWQFGIDYQLEFPVAAAGSIFVFGVASVLTRGAPAVPALRVISYLGRISLTIMVVHIIGTSGTRIVLGKALHIQTGWVHLVAGTLVGLALPILVQVACTRLGLLKLLGLPQLSLKWPATAKLPVLSS